ncbi:MAG: glycosyl hydrolase [Coraliomargaritaceae bacterium]
MKTNLSVFLLPLCSLFLVGQSSPTFIPGEDPRPDGMQWEKVENMSDDFSAESVDLKKWQVEPNQNSFTWIGRPPGLFLAENVSVKDGNLCVQVGVLDEPFEGEEGLYTYSGGIVRSIEPGEPGWYYECRMKANKTEMSSTFWLLTIGGPDEALETDIQECVGRVTRKPGRSNKKYDQGFHSNTHHWRYFSEPRQTSAGNYTTINEKNHSRFFVYGAWWKSPEEIQFFLDGKYMHSIRPKSKWDIPAYLHMAIETYNWNPIPEDGGLVASGTLEERTTQYDWIRTWKLVKE